MKEWGIPFDHIESHWTERQFLMFIDRLSERYKKKPGGKSKVSFLEYAKGKGVIS